MIHSKLNSPWTSDFFLTMYMNQMCFILFEDKLGKLD